MMFPADLLPRRRTGLWRIAALFWLASLIACLAHAPRVFHEVDSAVVATSMSQPAQSATQYVGWSYKPTQWSDPNVKIVPATRTLQRVIASAPAGLIRRLARTPAFDRYYHMRGATGPVPADPAVLRPFMLRMAASDPRLTSLPLHGVYRLGQVTVVSALPMPGWLRAAILLPLGSTYSLGPGLVYGLVYAARPDPAAFLVAAGVVTVLLFHLAIALMAGVMRACGLEAGGAVATVWMLFATSLYSYGFHLGSTIWMVASAVAFLLAYARGASPRRLSLAAGVLVFFNYLIVVYYGAALLVELTARLRDPSAREGWGRRLGRTAAAMAKAHWPGLLLILLCVVAFFQPGQGARGHVQSLAEVPPYALHIVVNLMGVSWGQGSQTTAVMLVEAVVIAAVVAAGVLALRRRVRAGDARARRIAELLLGLLATYVLFCLVKLLNPAPTRHILFLAPPFFVLAGFALDRALARLRSGAAVAAIIAVGVAGLVAQQLRFPETVRPDPAVPAERVAGAYGNAIQYVDDHHLATVASEAIGAGGTFLYADTDCDLACFARTAPTLSAFKCVAVTAIRPAGDVTSATKALAFPMADPDGRFAFDRTNSLHLALVTTAPRR